MMTIKLRVNEVFYSLQGEGYRAGEATVFIRLAACDLTCGFCDTEFESGKELTLDELYATVLAMSEGARSTPWITWTGGEPLLQLTNDVLFYFAAKGFRQSVETNGNHGLQGRHFDWVVVSPKVAEHVVARNFKDDEIDELRYAWHAGKTDVPRPKVKARNYYLSPIFDGSTLDAKNLHHCIKLCLENPQWKLSLQTHKTLKIL